MSDSYAYVADQSDGLRIININNPADPFEEGYYNTPGLAYGVTVFGNYAYMADRDAGMLIIKNNLVNDIPENKIHNGNNLAVSCFPNPFSNRTTINFHNPTHSNYKLSVFSISGNKVFEMYNIKSDKIEFEKGNLPQGIYLIELKGEKVFRGKMVVK